MGRPTTRRKPDNASRPRDGYDPYADELTRPDIVPAEVRFALERENLSSILERREQEVFAKSDWHELRRRNEATVVDGPVLRPSGPVARSQSSDEADTPKLPRSGPRHRAPMATPSSGVIENARAGAPQVDPSRERGRHQQVRLRAASAPPPVQRRYGSRVSLILMVAWTMVAAATAGTSLADGVLKHVVDRIASNFIEPEAAHAPLPLPTSAPPSAPIPVTRKPIATPTPSEEVSEVPVVRLEDLPQATENERDAKASAKTKGKTKRAVSRLRRRPAP